MIIQPIKTRVLQGGDDLFAEMPEARARRKGGEFRRCATFRIPHQPKIALIELFLYLAYQCEFCYTKPVCQTTNVPPGTNISWKSPARWPPVPPATEAGLVVLLSETSKSWSPDMPVRQRAFPIVMKLDIK